MYGRIFQHFNLVWDVRRNASFNRGLVWNTGPGGQPESGPFLEVWPPRDALPHPRWGWYYWLCPSGAARVLQRNKTNRAGMCVCVYGERERVILKTWLTPLWRQASLKPVGQASWPETQRRVDVAAQVQSQSGGRHPASLGDLSLFSLKAFPWLITWDPPTL